jgi:hypothetical protein
MTSPTPYSCIAVINDSTYFLPALPSLLTRCRIHRLPLRFALQRRLLVSLRRASAASSSRSPASARHPRCLRSPPFSLHLLCAALPQGRSRGKGRWGRAASLRRGQREGPRGDAPLLFIFHDESRDPVPVVLPRADLAAPLFSFSSVHCCIAQCCSC